MQVGAWGTGQISAASPQSCCETKSDLKKLSLKKKLNFFHVLNSERHKGAHKQFLCKVVSSHTCQVLPADTQPILLEGAGKPAEYFT